MSVDKENQIREIETIIKSNLAEGSFANAFAKKVAIQIVEYYQPKLPEDRVVLSKEDYQLWNVLKKTWASDDKEVSAEDMLETLKNTKELGSKETAKKLIEDMSYTIKQNQNIVIRDFDGLCVGNKIIECYYINECLDKFAQQFGIEIKE